MHLNIPNLTLGVHWVKLLWTFHSSWTTKGGSHAAVYMVSSSKLMLNYVIVILFNPSRLFKKTCDGSTAFFHHMTNACLAMDWALQSQPLALMCLCMSLVFGHPVLQKRTRTSLKWPNAHSCHSRQVKEPWGQEGKSHKKQAQISGLFGWEVFALLAVA